MRHSLISLVVVFLCACSIRAPEIKITGEKTALENQVLGTYREIEEDTRMIASTRIAGERGRREVLSIEKRRVLDAILNRRFNKDDIDEFKRDGVIGENNQGFLEIRPSDKLEKDPEYKKRVLQLVAQENRDRKIIMDRVIAVNENIREEDREKVYAVFAKMNRDSAEKGTWIQLPDGRWVRK